MAQNQNFTSLNITLIELKNYKYYNNGKRHIRTLRNRKTTQRIRL